MSDGSEFAARIYAAINARDRGAIKALTAPDVVVKTTVEAYRGPEALIEWMEEGDDAFDDFTVELLEIEELGGHVVVSMRQRGRGNDGFLVANLWPSKEGSEAAARDPRRLAVIARAEMQQEQMRREHHDVVDFIANV